MALTLDHLVVSAERLADGVAWVEARLGVSMAEGGKHTGRGTHNALLGLGEVYLEVIAPDPDAPDPGRARMFDLDNFSGAPRLTNWVARTGDLTAALAQAPAGAGPVKRLSRGDFRWTMSVPDDGKLPFGGGFPGLICWDGEAHPVQRLPDTGCRLSELQVVHPQGEALRDALAVYTGGLADCVATAPQPGFRATISTRQGPVVLV